MILDYPKLSVTEYMSLILRINDGTTNRLNLLREQLISEENWVLSAYTRCSLFSRMSRIHGELYPETLAAMASAISQCM